MPKSRRAWESSRWHQTRWSGSSGEIWGCFMGDLLVLWDVDGTLLTDEKTLTARTKAAVAALRSNGIVFSMISSRPPRGRYDEPAPQSTAPQQRVARSGPSAVRELIAHHARLPLPVSPHALNDGFRGNPAHSCITGVSARQRRQRPFNRHGSRR